MKNNYPRATKSSPFKQNKIINETLEINENFIFKQLTQQSTNNHFEEFVDLKRNKLLKFSQNFQNVKTDIFNYLETVNKVSNKVLTIKKGDFLNLLLFGFIQSGKTDFMMGLTIKLIDSFPKSNAVIVLTSANTSLLHQTINRFEKTFSDLSLNVNMLDFSLIKEDPNGDGLIKTLKHNKKTVIFLMKQKEHLENCVRLLSQISDDSLLDNVTILDDEADNASFDNQFTDEYTTIHRNVRELIGVCQQFSCAYVPVTATPFAHLMVKQDDILKPDYAYILHPGSSYIGLNYYVDESEKYNSHIVKEISEKIYRGNLELSDNQDLIRALINYLIQCWIFLLNKTKLQNRKPRMLVNIQRENVTHEITKQEIYKLLDFIRTKKDYYLNKYFQEELLNYYGEESDDEGLILSISPSLSPEFVYNSIIDNVLDDVRVRILNSDSSNYVDYHKMNLDDYQKDEYQIIIGSDKLGRGLTFVDLTTAFLARRSEFRANGDTVLQQARWLGYRQQYKRIMKVYLLSELISDYSNINTVINYLVSLIGIYEKNDWRFNEIDRRVPLSNYDDTFKLVRDAISRTESIHGPKFHYMNNKIEINSIEKPITNLNQEVYNRFINLYDGQLANDYPVIYFEDIDDFNQQMFGTLDSKQLYEKYKYIFGLGRKSHELVTFEKLLFFKQKPVCLRLIHSVKNPVHFSDNLNENYYYRERKLNIGSSSEVYSFGQGNYEDEYSLFNSDKFLCIDIIPIQVWTNNYGIISENEVIKTFRARLFMPHEITKDFEYGLIAID